MNIKQLLADLPNSQKVELMAAFEECTSYHIDLGDGHYIGVHMKDDPQFKIIERKGLFSYGEIT